MFEELLELYKSKSAEVERQQKETQAMITMIMAIDKISSTINAKQSDVELLGRLIDQVDRLSKDVADLKSQMKARQGRVAIVAPVPQLDQVVAVTSEGRALDNHARTLVDLMSERPGRYTTSELVDMLGLNKTTVISVMKRAVDLDPKHVKLTQGKRRKLHLAYIPDDEGQTSDSSSSSDEDRMKLELMAMT
jgi:hypothetical protein